MENTQTVTETNTESQTSGAETDAQDLESLLNKYEDGTQGEQQETRQQDTSSLEAKIERLEKRLQEQEEKEIREKVDTDIQSAAEIMAETLDDLPVKISPSMVRGFIREKAESDPRILNAWQLRNRNPSGWRSIVKGLAKDMRGEMEVDKEATKDRKALTNAVRGASQSSPRTNEAEDYNKMSDKEFNKVLNELGL